MVVQLFCSLYVESECKIPGNGFVRDCEFMLLESYEDYAEFILSSDDDTIDMYPFSFNIIVAYKLLGRAFEITCRAGNFAEHKMPYSVGINTYFPVSRSVRLEAEFDRDEVMEGYMLKDGLYCGEVKRLMPQNGKALNIEKNSQFVIKNIISDSVALLEDSKALAQISAEGLPHFAVCNSDEYISVGMWQGFAGSFGRKDDFLKKDDIKFADENSSDEYRFLLSFNI